MMAERVAEGKALAGQVALVTGAAKRIGRSIALRLAREGADVAVNYGTSKAEADELVSAIRAMGRRSVAVQGDVSKRPEVVQLFSAVATGIWPARYSGE